MEEIEVKILEIDLEKVLRKLDEIGAKKVLEGQIESFYFDYKDNSLRGQGIVLRLRKDSNKCWLTMKNKLKKTTIKVMQEIEVEVSNIQKMKQIFGQLDLIEYYSDTRKRISYKLGDCCLDIDIYPNIPPFMEIEAATQERLKELIKQFDFSENQIKAWTGKDLLAHYRKL